MSLGKPVCLVCTVMGGGGVGMRDDLSGIAGLTSFAFLDAGSESVEDAGVLLLVMVVVVIEVLVVGGSGR